MIIYVAEQYHDNDCGIWSTREAAIKHLDSCSCCRICSYELTDCQFTPTGDEIYYWRCENCGEGDRSDITPPFHMDSYDYCSLVCGQETREFYDSGKIGIHGCTTREAKIIYGRGKVIQAGITSTKPHIL